MGLFSRKSSDNELGEYLPEEDAQQYEQYEALQANSRPEAEEKCKEIAAEYGGTDAKVEKTGNQDYDCKFKLWG